MSVGPELEHHLRMTIDRLIGEKIELVAQAEQAEADAKRWNREHTEEVILRQKYEFQNHELKAEVERFSSWLDHLTTAPTTLHGWRWRKQFGEWKSQTGGGEDE